jgi:hypothetical protein
VAAGEAVQFKMSYGGVEYANAHACGLHWYVDDVEGGNWLVGTISACGRYTAPAVLPNKEIWISGEGYERGCADCCPGALRKISFER